MPTYRVIRKADGQQVYEYTHDEPVEWHGMEYTEYDHVLQPEIHADGSIEGQVIGHELDGLEFMRRLTAMERIAARTLAKTDPIMEDFVALLDKADVVHTDDPDLRSGIGYMVAMNILSQDRANEVLA